MGKYHTLLLLLLLLLLTALSIIVILTGYSPSLCFSGWFLRVQYCIFRVTRFEKSIVSWRISKSEQLLLIWVFCSKRLWQGGSSVRMSVLQYTAAKLNKLPILPCWAHGGARNSSSSSILLTERAQQSSRDVCETAHEALVLKFLYMCIRLTVCLSHYWYVISDLTLGSVMEASAPTEVNSYNLTKNKSSG